MTPSPHNPPLRLVSAPVAARHRVLRLGNTGETGAERAARLVQRENRAAATMGPVDPRLVFASQVVRELANTRGVLPPDRRQLLLAAAARSGLRPFDASLVIALVQDRARRGETLSPDALRGMVLLTQSAAPPSAPTTDMLRTVGLAILCLALAAAWAGLIVRWILN